MNLLALEGKTLLITLAFIILIVSAIIFYSLRRFAVLENSIIQQGKILQSVIMKIEHGQRNYPPQFSNERAVNSAKIQLDVQDKNTTQKIDVSDDDDSGDDDSDNDDSDDDDDSCDDDDSDDELNNSNNISELISSNITLETSNLESNLDLDLDLELIATNAEVKFINIEEINNLESGPVLQTENIDSDSNSNTDSNTDSNTNSDINLEIVKTPLETLNISDELVVVKKGLSKMKVNELRELVINKGILEDLDEVNKLKKDNLIKLLQEQ